MLGGLLTLTSLCACHLGKSNTGDGLLKGMTISTREWGHVWGTDGFGETLDRLKELGINSVAIHPYARIFADGRVSSRWTDSARRPIHITRPIEEAHRRGMAMMIKPHLAYWGTPFSWRGAIRFDREDQRQRFFDTYRQWILSVARWAKAADIFVVGCELKHLIGDAEKWRALIADVRKVTSAKLTYAANWDTVERVRFWRELDLVGVQGYFPLSEKKEPTVEDLKRGWSGVVDRLRGMHQRTGKPIVFTELGYNRSSKAAQEPWAYRTEPTQRAGELQAQCLETALQTINQQSGWIEGVFLWKWFVRHSAGTNFLLDTPRIHRILTKAWRTR